MTRDGQSIFQDVREFPDLSASRQFNQLRGLDEKKERLLKEARILLDPTALQMWSKKNHGRPLPLLSTFANRAPLFIFGGDVGTGKSALAQSVGDPIARQMKIPVTLFELSLSARGSGAVGEMTRLISMAFAEVGGSVNVIANAGKRPSGAAILLIDEADALAQSRESQQMHHEDRAGVNAVIRGVDQLAAKQLPVIVLMCTNRLDSIDPAVRRRAADCFVFERPEMEQRLAMLTEAFEGVSFSSTELEDLAKATGPSNGRDYGFTYSDIAQRLLPRVLLDAFPERPLTYDVALRSAETIQPTPPFRNGGEYNEPT